MAIAAEGDAGFWPFRPDAANKTAQMGTHLNTGWRLAGPEDHGDRTAGGGVVNMDGQEAVLVVVGVEQRQLLAAMDDVAGVVDIERDAFGRCGIARHPLVDEGIGQADGIVQERRILQSRQGRLRAKISTVVRQAAAGELEGRIGAQPVEVVAVLIAAGNRQDPGADHVRQPMGDAVLVAGVGNERGETLDDTQPVLDGGKQHHAAIRRKAPAIKGGGDLLAGNGWKIKGRNSINVHGGCGAKVEAEPAQIKQFGGRIQG